MKITPIITKTEYVIMTVILVVLALGIVSCEDDEKNKFNIISGSEGAFVRFAEPFPSVVDVSSLDQLAAVSITTVIESPDNNVVRYSMSVGATISGETMDPMPLGNEITSFPTSLTITMDEIASALGIATSDIGFGDTFDFVGTAVNEAGTIYTSERQRFDQDTKEVTGGNNSADLLDEDGYRNAFEFGFAIPCPAEAGDFAGDWTFEMIDLYGDGWDNAFVTVDIDGTATNYTVEAGSSQNHIVNVPAGTQRLVISYTPGSFEEEHVYTVTKPDGTIIGPLGPNPGLCIN